MNYDEFTQEVAIAVLAAKISDYVWANDYDYQELDQKINRCFYDPRAIENENIIKNVTSLFSEKKVNIKKYCKEIHIFVIEECDRMDNEFKKQKANITVEKMMELDPLRTSMELLNQFQLDFGIQAEALFWGKFDPKEFNYKPVEPKNIAISEQIVTKAINAIHPIKKGFFTKFIKRTLELKKQS